MCVVVIFGIYASETFPQMSKVAVDRLVLETEGVVSHDLAELFRQVEHCFISSLCDLLIMNIHQCLCMSVVLCGHTHMHTLAIFPVNL